MATFMGSIYSDNGYRRSLQQCSAHWKPRQRKVEKNYFPKYCDSDVGNDGSGVDSAQYGRIHHQKLKCFPKKIILGPPPHP